MELLQTIEAVRQDQAGVRDLFGDAGVRVRGTAMQEAADYERHLAGAAALIEGVLTGRQPSWMLQEAMTTSDFPLMFGDIMDRALLAAYREYPAVWEGYAQARTVRDFRTVNLFDLTGGTGVLSAVPERTEYPVRALDETRYQLSVAKYGATMGFSWEMLINDDLDTFSRAPQVLAEAARRTEQRIMTALYVDANGPHANVYTGGNANQVTGNPTLSITGLATAMGVLAAQENADGEPIVIDAVTLVVPPALEITANNILNATEIMIEPNATAGTENQNVRANNWMRNRVRLVVDPYIPAIASSANGNTSWFLFANQSMRPALVGARLRGHETPELFIKESNQRRVGGGGLNALDGDFATDAIEYKVRHVFGGAVIDPKMTVASSGAGS